jgi:hypothetical protein
MPESGSSGSRSATASAARGIAVIVAAVVVGLLLLNRGLDGEVVAADGQTTTTTTAADDDGATDGTDGGDTTVTTADPTSPTETTAPPPAEARPPAEVRVLVLNGSGQQGAAGRGAQFFQEQGYQIADPKNAPRPGPSTIVYVEGFEAEANAAAATLGVDPARVVQPLDPAAPPIDDTQGANLIVQAGTDGVISF